MDHLDRQKKSRMDCVIPYLWIFQTRGCRKELINYLKMHLAPLTGLDQSLLLHLVMRRVFANGPGNRGSIPGWVIPKTQKWYLMPPCLTLSTIRWGLRVKWSNPGNGVAPSLHLCVVAVEKGAFGSTSTKVPNLQLVKKCCTQRYYIWRWYRR